MAAVAVVNLAVLVLLLSLWVAAWIECTYVTVTGPWWLAAVVLWIGSDAALAVGALT